MEGRVPVRPPAYPRLFQKQYLATKVLSIQGVESNIEKRRNQTSRYPDAIDMIFQSDSKIVESVTLCVLNYEANGVVKLHYNVIAFAIEHCTCV